MIAKKHIGKRIPNEAEIANMIRDGKTSKQIAAELGVHRMTVRRVGVRLGLRYSSDKRYREAPLEYSPLHDKPYEGPKVKPSTTPVEQAARCSKETIKRVMKGGLETQEATAEIYRIASQFHVGKEPSRPEFVIASYECSPRRGTATVGFEPAATPKS